MLPATLVLPGLIARTDRYKRNKYCSYTTNPREKHNLLVVKGPQTLGQSKVHYSNLV